MSSQEFNIDELSLDAINLIEKIKEWIKKVKDELGETYEISEVTLETTPPKATVTIKKKGT